MRILAPKWRSLKTKEGVWVATDVYDAFGNLAAEYGMVASAACTTCYLSYDHLGSVRLVTDQNANVVARHDDLPFGEEIPANTAGRNSQWGLTADVEQKFTGQIRDNETGMDYFNARYFTGALGRFNSSDPLNLGADATDPQTWNGYAYVRNNPLALVDPMGLCTFDAEGNAVEDENGACYEGGFGGSVTVTASPPPDVMPIFVSLPSLLSDSQQPMQSAPPAVTEAGVGVKPPKSGNCQAGVIGNFVSKYIGGNTILSGNITSNTPTIELGAAIGSLAGPPGEFAGALIGSMFGVGGSVSYVPGTGSVSAGPVATFGVGVNGGSGFSVSAVHVPASQNANSIASGKSFSLSYQPNPFLGSTVTKSPGSGPPVVGPSIGTKVPVSASAGYSFCLRHCGC
jgi:RHS repeat-associated protein